MRFWERGSREPVPFASCVGLERDQYRSHSLQEDFVDSGLQSTPASSRREFLKRGTSVAVALPAALSSLAACSDKAPEAALAAQAATCTTRTITRPFRWVRECSEHSSSRLGGRLPRIAQTSTTSWC
jgi:hypothetical protein